MLLSATKRVLGAVFGTLLVVVLGAQAALADDPTGGNLGAVPEEVSHTDFSLNILWIVLGAVLVIFMQAGFAALTEIDLQEELGSEPAPAGASMAASD